MINNDFSEVSRPEDISGEEEIKGSAGSVNPERSRKSPASRKNDKSAGRSSAGDDPQADIKATDTSPAGEEVDKVSPAQAGPADEPEPVENGEPDTISADQSTESEGTEPYGTDQVPTGMEASEPLETEASETAVDHSIDTETPELIQTDAIPGGAETITNEIIDPDTEGADLTGSGTDTTELSLTDTSAGNEESPQQTVTGTTPTGSSDNISPVSAPVEFDYSTLSRQDLINRLQELINNQQVQNIMSDVDHIKLNFYKKFKQETEQKRKKFVEDGGNIEDFQVAEDPLEFQIKELLKSYRSRKSDYNRNIESEKHENLKLKYEVIEKIKDLVNRKESINKTFQEFRELQKEWRSIGLVPQSSLKDLWENYNYHVEKFYDYIKINKELRDLDLKKNLEAKIRFCEKAESLLLEPSVLNAFKSLQKLHDQWREIGPVSAEKRSEIWDRFKEVTYKINKKHQQHFEDLKNTQKRNLEQKKLLCEKAEEINQQVLSTQKQWDERSKELIELQKVWRTIGFAPKKDNNKIYMRFREACDTFFNLKRDFYTQNKEIQLNNLQMKTELCMQAELLKESSDWKKTTEELIALQKKWKEIGPIPKKYSEQIWRRFRAACDHFFEQKAGYFRNIDKTYESNLQKKDQLIKEIEEFVASDKIEENFRKLNEFQRRWTEIGFVPFENKEELQERYRIAINRHFDSLKIDENQKSLLKFQNRLDAIMHRPNVGGKLQQEREKCVARLQQLNNDIVLWENNIGFFAKSKNAESMIQDINNKIKNTRDTIRLLEAKIEMIDNLDSNQPD